MKYIISLLPLLFLVPCTPASAEERAEPEPAMIDPREGGFEVGMGEWAITMEASAIRPGPVTFIVSNGGKLRHGLRIRSKSHSGGKKRGRDRLRQRTELIPPGGRVELRLNLPSGRYEVECYVEDEAGEHDRLGMHTILTVSEDAPLSQVRAEPSSTEVSMRGFAFSPATIEVRAGSRVTWTNRDPAAHTVNSKDGSFSSGTIDPERSYSHVFDKPGTFPYSCAIHPAMVGRVKVLP